MPSPAENFEPINRGYNATFSPGRLSLGLVAPIEAYPHSPVPGMKDHVQRIQLAEKLGFSAIWLRDVPFNVPSFGDAGQLFDPFVYLGLLAGATENITLGVASIVLPLRHPAHVAKAAASADLLSGGRLVLGIASGDRPDEYPSLNLPYENRGERFRDAYEYMRHMAEHAPAFDNRYGNPNQGGYGAGMDMLPKPVASKLPLLITGGSQQDPEWIARHGDGWMLYPRESNSQARIIEDWRARVKTAGRPAQPVVQALYIDLAEDPNEQPRHIHLGFRLGSNHLRDHLKTLEAIGVNHIALNLRFNQANIETTLQRLADEILPEFPASTIAQTKLQCA